MVSKVKILLDRTEPSNRLHVIALDLESQSYLSIKISSPEEIIERDIKRNYKDILNAYMLFMIDFQTAFKATKKSNKQFRSNSKSFKKPLLFWETSPSEVTDEYKRIFKNYKKLKPKARDFIPFRPKESASKNNDQPQFENLDQDNSLNNMNNFNPQPETIQSENFEINQNNSPNNFLQPEFIQNLSSDYVNFIYNNIRENENLIQIDQDNSFNAINQISPLETIHFENFEVLLDQNNYTNSIIHQSEVIQYPSENVYFANYIEGNENLFYLDQNNFSNTDNLISQSQFENFEVAFQNNYMDNFIFQPGAIQYPSIDFEIS
ncbi:hypothetical protein RhiirA5_471610 [Rhizophagus irregularis]|uniref:Uncharacterized protein n=1 Tax=Rhizophagus irregularis TaxID=588596 RepID=A0A2I1E816_9GLOM|nr:hypothetical protein RhiirA5_471610 [Rhizophagus irregularis]PKY18285.1 hypothetical protein RhiirB3_490779 [Rhizophagus irregularis]CAB5121968.1 unnamed protein product [Rhizophagus irregularis]CAB5372671.1 unnamed protein product [Rhizophagus irregularis]